MVRSDGNALQNARVIIDGSGDRLFRQDLQRYLKRAANGKIKAVHFGDSIKDPLVQLADMCVGAIARSYRADRKDNARWRNMLRNKIDDVWEFR
jgi:hypothetical protein